MKNKVTLITGGCRSGKSSYALEITESYDRKVFIATAEAFDDEMADRISRHQEERGNRFTTIEESIHLADALANVLPDTQVVIIDCITVWLGNLMHHQGIDEKNCAPVGRFLEVLASPPCDVVIVSNEVGMGLIPADAMSRAYRDLAGSVNQKIAAVADEAFLVVSGIPLKLK
ncbi:MAG: bifunctional adenosylcobinamide kinase/adenosylcobinamide-phosphate guanylyltransferase [Desulfobacteraceae bacterium]|jgi:adenosylcobinamide kinase/adenosylcobinamide-phosphate guanylyltransferase|nr:bifunctional adenosylcobinamide kinase/adenosylcobinamide-phosphate guanylyltransferase [Desulfobacteraceae bacterium]